MTDNVFVYQVGDGFVLLTSLNIPAGNTDSRPTPNNGSIRYNTDFNYIEYGMANTAWVPTFDQGGEIGTI